MQEYNQGYKSDLKLPKYPAKLYADNWGGAADFFGGNIKFYETYSEAQVAARKLGFNTSTEYIKGYKDDPKLPSNPTNTYSDDWVNWEDFLIKVSFHYTSYADAKYAVKEYNFKSYKDYKQGHMVDPKLPSMPHIIYQNDWINWTDFLAIDSPYYKTYNEAKASVIDLGLKYAKEYLQGGYKLDSQLPREPKFFYKNDWISWSDFLGVTLKYYQTYQEAQAIVQELGIQSSTEYLMEYKTDPKLPRSPKKFYEQEWSDWDDFLIPTLADSLIKAKTVVQRAGIKSAREYAKSYKDLNKKLPRHPERVFKSDWVSWYDYLGIEPQAFYSYAEASELMKANGVSTQFEYNNYRVSSKNKKLYGEPSVHYDEWINWYVFLGTDEPFQPQYIRGEYISWKEAIESFMVKALGGKSKQNILCKFLKLYIQKNKLGFSPVEFLCLKNVSHTLFYQFLEQEFSTYTQNTAVNGINDFLDFILRTQLTIEDDETGELVKINGAKNHFQDLYVEQTKTARPTETVKPMLQFQFLNKARKWIFPDSAKCFSDLNHIFNRLDADWYEIDSNLIDELDPDCIVKKVVYRGNTKYYIWSPINWVHTYVLMELTLRGVQIAYNDSGEGDSQIPDIDKNGKIFWRENDGPLAGQTKNQSFVKKYHDNQLGYFVTSNKTSKNYASFSVPWIPIKVAYWLIKLRNWQTKYNPIKVATPWVELTRTNLNHMQLKAKGSNCFLFRGFGQVEPISFQAALADRIAVALYYTQPEELNLADCESKKFQSVSHYKSQFTPHCLRVGLISALIFEFGLSPEVVMKIVGHSAIVMTIYYAKINSSDLRKRMEEGEKKALKNKTFAIQRHIEQQKISQIKNEEQLVANSEEVLSLLDNDFPGSSFTFSDLGICPFANSRCHEGGDEISNSSVFAPVPQGYIGKQNCIRCRFFLTGPAYIGGLLARHNEITLQTKIQAKHYSKIEDKINACENHLNELDIQEYENQNQNLIFSDDTRRLELERELRRLNVETEIAATKMDMFLCDLQCTFRLINQCQDLLNKQELNDKPNQLMLIKQSQEEMIVDFEETNDFHQLSEVCENAEIYDSASADMAITQRSQLLDKMADFNGMKPFFFTLTEQQQLELGNQVTRLMLARLKSWDKVAALVDGNLQFADLIDSEQKLKKEIDTLYQEKSFPSIRI